MMSNWAGRQVTILGVVSFLIFLIALGAGSAWTQRMWLAREATNHSEQAKCENSDHECAQKDLPSQIRAAAAAEAMVDIGLWQLIVGSIGLAAVGASLILNAQSVMVARQVGEAQARAYLSVERLGISFNHEKKPRLHVTLRNSGQSPALKVRVNFKMTYQLMTPVHEDLTPMAERREPRNSGIMPEDTGDWANRFTVTVDAQGTTNLPPFVQDFPLTDEEMSGERALIGEVSVIVNGIDVFGKALKTYTSVHHGIIVPPFDTQAGNTLPKGMSG